MADRLAYLDLYPVDENYVMFGKCCSFLSYAMLCYVKFVMLFHIVNYYVKLLFCYVLLS